MSYAYSKVTPLAKRSISPQHNAPSLRLALIPVRGAARYDLLPDAGRLSVTLHSILYTHFAALLSLQISLK
jgi:hypothetical protein